MAVNITVNRNKPVGISAGCAPCWLAAQRLGRGQYAMTSAKLDEMCDMYLASVSTKRGAYHWAGFGGQQNDWAPSGATRVWAGTGTGNQGNDEIFGVGVAMPTYPNAPSKALIQRFRDRQIAAGRTPDFQGGAILYDTPGAMNNWSGPAPHRKQWGTNAQATGTVTGSNGTTTTLTGHGGAALVQEFVGHYPGRTGEPNAVGFVSFGQEVKDVDGSSTRNGFFDNQEKSSNIFGNTTWGNWRDRIDGFTYLKKGLNTLGVTVEAWAFHLDVFSGTTATQMDQFIADVLAGRPGNWGPRTNAIVEAFKRFGHDATIADTNGTWPTLPAPFDPTLLPDRITVDVSVMSDARWPRDYANGIKRVDLNKAVGMELDRLMTLYWGAANVKPKVLIEDYPDFQISGRLQSLSPAQQAAFVAAEGLNELGFSHRFNWEPQGGDLSSSTAKLYDEMSHFTPYDTSGNAIDPIRVYPQWLYERDRANALPAGTQLWETLTDDPNVHAAAGLTPDGDSKLVVVNLSGTAQPLSISVTGADSPPATGIGGNTQLVIDLPGAPLSEAHDGFNRTVTAGLGAADVGGSYEIGGLASDYNVAPSAATFRMAPGQTRRANLPALFVRDVHANIDSAMDKLAVGGSIFAYLSLRELSIDGDMYYAIQERTVTGTIKLGFGKRVGAVETIVVAPSVIARETDAAGTFFRIVGEAEGASPTTLRAKVYRVGTAVPGSWDVTGTDSEPTLQVAGRAGCRSFLASTATNGPVTASFKNFDAVAIGAPPPPPPPQPEPHMALTNFGANKQLDEWYGSGSPAAYYLQLWQGDPGPLGTASLPILARVQVLNDAVHWPIAANRRKVNGLKLSWGSTAGQNTNPDATWVTIHDAPSGGNMIEKVPLDAPVKTADAAEVAIQPGQLALTR